MADEVRFSKDAEVDLAAIASYTADRFGDVQELRYRDGLRRALEMLAMFPAMGAEQSHIVTGLRRHVYSSHAIYYSQHAYGVLIERILGPGHDPVRAFES